MRYIPVSQLTHCDFFAAVPRLHEAPASSNSLRHSTCPCSAAKCTGVVANMSTASKSAKTTTANILIASTSQLQQQTDVTWHKCLSSFNNLHGIVQQPPVLYMVPVVWYYT